jgi:GAF domain-containing protein
LSIDNAQLFSRTEDALQEVQAAHQLYLAEAWREFLARKPVAQVDYAQPGGEPRDEELLASARRAAMLHRRTVATGASISGEEPSDAQSALVIPLELRGQVIGTIALHETRRQKLWNAEDIALAETVAEQVGLTIENMRLMDQTQRRVVTERIVRDISDRMQRAPDLETLMRVTAEELNRLLGGSHVYVRMGAAGQPSAGGDA